jgi:hypothetical protein
LAKFALKDSRGDVEHRRQFIGIGIGTVAVTAYPLLLAQGGNPKEPFRVRGYYTLMTRTPRQVWKGEFESRSQKLR